MEPPEPMLENVLSALGPWILEEHLKHSDFSRRYEGYLTVEEIKKFDDLAWLEVKTLKDLWSFRNGSFRGKAKAMPPIIVVTGPKRSVCHTQIGDGRGRVNFANGHRIKLHVWHWIHRDCLVHH